MIELTVKQLEVFPPIFVPELYTEFVNDRFRILL